MTKVRAALTVAVLVALLATTYSCRDRDRPGAPPPAEEPAESEEIARERVPVDEDTSDNDPAVGEEIDGSGWCGTGEFESQEGWSAPVEVRVISAEDGAPIPGALVTVHAYEPEEIDPDFQSGTTDESGVVLLPRPPSVRTWETSHARFVTSFERPEDVLDVDTVRLVPGAPVRGVVVHASDGAPVPGARVLARTDDYAIDAVDIERVSDEEGHFEIAGIPPGVGLQVAVACDGFGSVVQRVSSDRTSQEVVLVMGRGASLTGTVRDTESRVVAGAEIFAVEDGGAHPLRAARWDTEWLRHIRSRAVSGPDGSFRFEGLDAPAGYVVHARDAAGREARSDVVTLGSGAVPDVDLTLQSLGRIVLSVVDADTGQPVSNERVRASIDVDWGGQRDDQTSLDDHENDDLHFADVFPGEHVLFVGPYDHLETRQRVTVAPGETLRVTVKVHTGVTLTGRIVDAAGEPLEASLSFFADTEDGTNHHGGGDAGADGRFVIENVPAVAGQLWVWHRKSRVLELNGIVPGADLGDVEVPRGVSVVGRVPEGVEVERYGYMPAKGGGSTGGAEISLDGRFEFDSLRPGERFNIYMSTSDGLTFVKRDLLLAPGETLDLGEISFVAGLSFDLEVLDHEGRPVEAATVHSVEFWNEQSARTDSRGRTRLENYVPGRCTLCVDVGGKSYRSVPLAQQRIDVRAGMETVVIRAPAPGSLRIRLVDPDGNPRAGMALNVLPFGPGGEIDRTRRRIVFADSLGRIVFAATPEEWTVEVRAGELVGEPPRVTVAPGETAEIEIVVR